VNQVEKTNGRKAIRDRNLTVKDLRRKNRDQYSKPAPPHRKKQHPNHGLVPSQIPQDANTVDDPIEDFVESEEEVPLEQVQGLR
jgi:hypothetical protein